MPKGTIRHMFPGNNTSRGFFSYYDYILLQEKAKKIYIIKGGPGVGKSTFIRQSAEDLADEGYDVEFMHCSSDPESLDGMVVPALSVAMIDGTAPHVVDPKNPGAVDETIHPLWVFCVNISQTEETITIAGIWLSTGYYCYYVFNLDKTTLKPRDRVIAEQHK